MQISNPNFLNSGVAITVAFVTLFQLTSASSLHGSTATFRQGVNGYSGTSDTHLNANQPNTALGNNTVVLVDQNNPISHGLVRFDNLFGSGPGQVPLNATITSATLTFVTSNVGDPIYGFRLLVPWDEATSTWNTMVNGVSIVDGELNEAPDFTLDGNAVGQVDNLDVTATVQGWLAGTFPNYGWAMTNSVGDGWQFPSSENANVAQRPTLTIVFDAPCAPIAIATQPAGGTVNEGNSFTFSVVVSGTDPLYQWFKDGVPIPDATNSQHSIASVLRTDEGTYTVSIVNGCTDAVNSDPAVLDVIPDDTAPTIACVYGTNDNVTLFVVFSEIVTNANDPVNYLIFPTGGGDVLTVASASYAGGGIQDSVVVLILDPATPLAPGGSYSISAGGVFDRFGNPIDPAEITPLSLYAENIFTISEAQIWTFDDSGTDLGTAWRETLFDDSAWKSGPALIGYETTPAALPEPLRTPAIRTNSSGGVIRTHYFRTHFDYSGAPGEGVLRFRTVLDDAAAIYLNGAEIFRRRLPAGPLNWQTEGIGNAVGNASYEGPFTVCVTNLMTGDNVIAVEVHQTGGNSSDMIWGLELSAVVPSITPVSIVTQPVGTNVLEPQPFSLRVEAGGSNPRYQWFRGGVAIPDATNAIYSVAASNCDIDNSTYHVEVLNDAPSSVLSDTVTVTVACDTIKPFVTCLYGTNDVVVIVFNETTTNGTDFINYYIDDEAGNPLAIASATYTSGTDTGTTVILVIDPSTPRDPNTAYKIRIGGIADLFENYMDEVTMPIPFFAGTPVVGVNDTQQWRYDTSGTDQLTAWREADYDDSGWSQGLALFDGDRGSTNAMGEVNCRDTLNGETVRTCITISNATGTAQIPTAYFRTRFNHTGPSTAVLSIRPFLDDGAVYYLNGREILRVRMSQTATITYTTLANGTVGDANYQGPLYVCVSNLVEGSNVLAAELHQASLTSSDMTFGTELSILSDQPPTPPARLTIVAGPNPGEVTITWTGTGVLQESTDLGNPAAWADVAGASGNSFTTTATGNRFYRVAPAP